MHRNERITRIKAINFSWQERDVLTAAERFMEGAMDFPLIEFVSPCFPELDYNHRQNISLIWEYISAAYHLQMSKKDGDDCTIFERGSQIYQLEAKRILGSFFTTESSFWTIYNSRQELTQSRPLVAIDALFYGSGENNHISYQLLLQCLKCIIKGHYTNDKSLKKSQLENAKRLIIDLPAPLLQSWINLKLSKI